MYDSFVFNALLFVWNKFYNKNIYVVMFIYKELWSL